jgi:hypothetical protein
MRRAVVAVSLLPALAVLALAAHAAYSRRPPSNGPVFDVVSIKVVRISGRAVASVSSRAVGFVLSGLAIAPVIRTAYPGRHLRVHRRAGLGEQRGLRPHSPGRARGLERSRWKRCSGRCSRTGSSSRCITRLRNDRYMRWYSRAQTAGSAPISGSPISTAMRSRRRDALVQGTVSGHVKRSAGVRHVDARRAG